MALVRRKVHIRRYIPLPHLWLRFVLILDVSSAKGYRKLFSEKPKTLHKSLSWRKDCSLDQVEPLLVASVQIWLYLSVQHFRKTLFVFMRWLVLWSSIGPTMCLCAQGGI